MMYRMGSLQKKILNNRQEYISKATSITDFVEKRNCSFLFVLPEAVLSIELWNMFAINLKMINLGN